MKATFVLLVLCLLAGCGGHAPFPQLLTADDVFSNRAETWQFRNGLGHICTVEVIPQSAGSTVWHYTKQDADCYWGPEIAGAELYFNMVKDGADWYSTGGRIIFPEGCPWCPGAEDFTYSVIYDPSIPRPYKIIASGNSSYETTQFDGGVDGVSWRTDSYTQYIETLSFKGIALVSEQWEGPCVHEKWWFAPGKGMVKVAPLDRGDCLGLPAELAMERIN